MHTRELTIETGDHPGLFDLTDACARFLAEVGATDGLLTAFVPHATAGIVVVELGAGSDADLLAALERLLPRDAAGATATGARATERTTSCHCWPRRRSRCRCWAAG